MNVLLCSIAQNHCSCYSTAATNFTRTGGVARLTCLPVTEEIAGSNPVRSAIEKSPLVGVFSMAEWVDEIRARLTNGRRVRENEECEDA